MNDHTQMQARPGTRVTLLSPETFPALRARPVRYLASAGIVLVVAAALLFFSTVLDAPFLLSLMAAVAVGALFGCGPGILAIALATLLYDFFFVPPVFRFSFGYPTAIAVSCFVITVLLTRMIERAVVRSGRDQKLRMMLLFALGRFSEGTKASQNKTLALGRLDGCAAGELYGWALEPDDPEQAAKVTLYVEGRPAAEALAAHYRPDVGRHCFYFDLIGAGKPDTEVSADVRFADGRLLPNAPLRVRTPPATAPRLQQAVLFVHISKTAGTAFREAIAENYKQSEIAYVYPDPPGMLCGELSLLPLEQRRGFRLVAGHFQYGIHNFFPQDSVYVTIVREPVARIVSEHRYLLEKRGGEMELGSAAASLTQILERQATLNLDNLLVRCFSGINERDLPVGAVNEGVYELALEHLRKEFCFVGHQERLAEAYAALQHKFGWKPRATFERVNVTRVGNEAEYEPARAAIEEHNRWDVKLYAEICRLYP
ncbi:MAG TPA: DUF4118 domain-containing protein [Bryobacteraceae bacterium]